MNFIFFFSDNGSCKNCVALLFALVDFTDRHHDRHTQVGTDIACVWDRPRISSQPMEIDDISLRIDDDEPSHKEPTQANFDPRSSVNVNTPHNVEKLVHKLCRGTGAVFNHILSDSSADSSDEEMLPLSVDEVAKKCKSKDDLISDLISHHDASTIASIEKLTRGQAENNNWYKYRKGRVTASLFSSVLHCRFTNQPSNYILDRVFMRKTAKSASLDYGRTHEPIARQAYTARYKKTHKKCKVKQCGLFIDKHYPFMGASPDALVECKCCGKGLLEIKCSYQFRLNHPQEACQDKDYHVFLDDDGAFRLKESSPWYVQIQGQLGVTGLDWCDFLLYTKKGFLTERIYFDKELYLTIVNKCEKFFTTYVLNEIFQ